MSTSGSASTSRRVMSSSACEVRRSPMDVDAPGSPRRRCAGGLPSGHLLSRDRKNLVRARRYWPAASVKGVKGIRTRHGRSPRSRAGLPETAKSTPQRRGQRLAMSVAGRTQSRFCEAYASTVGNRLWSIADISVGRRICDFARSVLTGSRDSMWRPTVSSH